MSNLIMPIFIPSGGFGPGRDNDITTVGRVIAVLGLLGIIGCMVWMMLATGFNFDWYYLHQEMYNKVMAVSGILLVLGGVILCVGQSLPDKKRREKK